MEADLHWMQGLHFCIPSLTAVQSKIPSLILCKYTSNRGNHWNPTEEADKEKTGTNVRTKIDINESKNQPS